MSESNSRIQEIDQTQLNAAQRSALEAVSGGRGFLPTPYKVWLHSAGLVGPMEVLGTFLNKRGSLTAREVEIAVLVIARHWHSEMVFTGHARTAEDLGVSAESIRQIASGKPATFADPREQAVYDTAVAAESVQAPSNDTFARSVDALGRDGLAEVLALLGYFSAVSIAMKMHRVTPQPKR